MKPDFISYIQDRVILGDGALGAYLYECGISREKNLDLLNIQSPDTVFNAHEEYILAGSQLIETNTFGANRFNLTDIGFGDKVRAINRAGAQIAVKAAGRKVYVAGSVGPTGVMFPLIDEEITIEEISASFREQFLGLAEGGVDVLIVETFNSLQEMKIALKVAKKCVPHLPVIAQMVFPAGEMTTYGDDVFSCATTMIEGGARIIGTNCGRGVNTTAVAIHAMAPVASASDVVLSAFPNAGLPETLGNRTIYPAQPDYMAKRAADMIKNGVHLIGGCCGTTPAHIHRFRSVLKIKPVRIKGAGRITTEEPEKLARENKSGKFLSNLKEDRLPLIVELDPPTNLEVKHILNGAEQLAQAGADAISLAENPLAILRAGNLGLASLIKQRTSLNTILHQTGRDLNALGLQARMMEAHLLGIESVLAVSGDSANGTDQPGVSGVFDLRSPGLISMLNGLNNGVNMAGKDLRGCTDFSIGAAFAYREDNPGMQIRRLEKKVDLGARFAMTQPLFSAEAVFDMLEKTAHIDVLIFPGIFPLISLRNAEFLHNEVPGIHVPSTIRKRLAAFHTVADQRKVALEYTAEIIDTISPVIDGLYLISPLNKWEIVLEYVNQVRCSGATGSRKIQRYIA